MNKGKSPTCICMDICTSVDDMKFRIHLMQTLMNVRGERVIYSVERMSVRERLFDF